MPLTRVVLAVLAAAATVLATPAVAAPACNLVADPLGDEDTYTDGALDIVSGDVASNRRDLTVAIRLDDLTTPALTSPTGANYSFIMHMGETTLELIAELSPSEAPKYSARRLLITRGGSARVVQPEPIPATVRGVVDVARDEVRMTVALRDLAKYGATRKGATVTRLNPVTWRVAHALTEEFVAAADHASSKASYRLGTASCLAVGR